VRVEESKKRREVKKSERKGKELKRVSREESEEE
jgi:hypothetical protein